jgi:hypothetical protein
MAGCGKQPQPKPLPNVTKQQQLETAKAKKLAPLGSNEKETAVEQFHEDSADYLATSKRYLKKAYGFAGYHWVAITSVCVAVLLIAVGYKHDIHTRIPEAWDWVKSKFKKASEGSSDEGKRKKAPPKKENEIPQIDIILPPSSPPPPKPPEPTEKDEYSYSDENPKKIKKTKGEAGEEPSEISFAPFDQKKGTTVELRPSVEKVGGYPKRKTTVPELITLPGLKSKVVDEKKEPIKNPFVASSVAHKPSKNPFGPPPQGDLPPSKKKAPLSLKKSPPPKKIVT